MQLSVRTSIVSIAKAYVSLASVFDFPATSSSFAIYRVLVFHQLKKLLVRDEAMAHLPPLFTPVGMPDIIAISLSTIDKPKSQTRASPFGDTRMFG